MPEIKKEEGLSNLNSEHQDDTADLLLSFRLSKHSSFVMTRFICDSKSRDLAHYMSLVMRKPVFMVSYQERHKPGCTTIEDG